LPQHHRANPERHNPSVRKVAQSRPYYTTPYIIVVGRSKYILRGENMMNVPLSKIVGLAALLLIVLLALAACAPAPTPTSVPPTIAPTAAAPQPTMAPAAAPAKPVALAVSTNDTFGKILTDGNGRTLYVFAQDTKDTPTCYDACATRWPPFLTQGKTDAMNGTDAASIGSAQRKDGTLQVTYKGSPLYYWNADTKPGDTLGQGIGGVWWVVAPDGTAIHASAKTTPPAPTTSPSGNSNYGYGN
jgi:predicted lipoprotein with Yx(FWY)xxD motif